MNQYFNLFAALFIGLLLISCSKEKKPLVFSEDQQLIAYTVEGENAPALLFVHGWCTDKSYWKHQIDYFSDDHKTAALDLIGHGASDKNRKSWTIESFGSDIVALVRALNLDDVIIVGHDLGALASVYATSQLGDSVSGVIAVGAMRDIDILLKEEEITVFMAPFVKDFKTTARSYAEALFPVGSDSLLIKRVADDISGCPKDFAVATKTAAIKFRPYKFIKDMEQPLILINPAQWPTNIFAINRVVPRFHFMRMANVGHFMMLERPGQFNEKLETSIEMIRKGL